jgi:hypothetical protein
MENIKETTNHLNESSEKYTTSAEKIKNSLVAVESQISNSPHKSQKSCRKNSIGPESTMTMNGGKLKAPKSSTLKCSECKKNEPKHLAFKCFTCKKEKCGKCALKDSQMYSQKLRGSSFLCAGCFANQSKLR